MDYPTRTDHIADDAACKLPRINTEHPTKDANPERASRVEGSQSVRQPDDHIAEDTACKLPRINTCRSASKQTTLSTFRINTYAKHRGEGAVDSASSLHGSRMTD